MVLVQLGPLGGSGPRWGSWRSGTQGSTEHWGRTGGGGRVSHLSESSFNVLCSTVFCLLAFKGGLQADSHQNSLILLYLCKFFNMTDGH